MASSTKPNTTAAMGVVLAFGLPLILVVLWVIFGEWQLAERSHWAFAAPPYVRPNNCSWTSQTVSPSCDAPIYDLGVGEASRFGLPISRRDGGRWVRLNRDAAEIICVQATSCIVEKFASNKFVNPTGMESQQLRKLRLIKSEGLIKLGPARYAFLDMF